MNGAKVFGMSLMPRLTALLAVPALVLGLTGSAGAQGSLQQRLAEATRLTCTFTLVATATWKSGAPAADVTPATLKVGFTNVNVDEGTADADSAFGSSFIVVRHANEYLHLMQSHSAGPLYTTTVFARDTKEGRMMAVHTRHEYTDVRLPGFTSRPEMYVGECALGQ